MVKFKSLKAPPTFLFTSLTLTVLPAKFTSLSFIE
jgi:hypothetical protein